MSVECGFASPSTMILDPPYRALRAARLAECAPGAILVSDLAGGVAAIERTQLLLDRAPWCSVCLLIRGEPVHVRTIRRFEPYPSAFAALPWPAATLLPHPAPVLAAIHTRPQPSPTDLAEYVARRTRRRDIAVALEQCFALPAQALRKHHDPSYTTLWRHLSTFRPLQAGDWRAVARLIRIIRHAYGAVPRSRERIAFDEGVDPRTLDAWLSRYAGVSLTTAVERPGWEWLTEVILRQHGYLDSVGALARASSRIPGQDELAE